MQNTKTEAGQICLYHHGGEAIFANEPLIMISIRQQWHRVNDNKHLELDDRTSLEPTTSCGRPSVAGLARRSVDHALACCTVRHTTKSCYSNTSCRDAKIETRFQGRHFSAVLFVES